MGHKQTELSSLLAITTVITILTFSSTLNEAHGSGPIVIPDQFCWPIDGSLTSDEFEITDQFGTIRHNDGFSSDRYCADADKIRANGEQFIFGATQHYQVWKFPGTLNFQDPGTGQIVDINIPQFGLNLQDVILGEPENIMVPADKITRVIVMINGIPEAVDTRVNSNDHNLHWKCYDISVANNLAETVTLITQHGSGPTTVFDPREFCTPIIKTHFDIIHSSSQTFGTLIPNHLTCFGVGNLSMENRVLQLDDQMNGLIDVEIVTVGGRSFDDRLCVESFKNLPGQNGGGNGGGDGGDAGVGGELLPTDSTALVIAGLQTSGLWMLSALGAVAVAGFGMLYFQIKRKQ